MPKGSSISLFMLIGVLCASLTGAPALDETRYPDWKGQWERADGAEAAQWGARKPWGLGQQPPLIPDHQALFEAAGAKASDPTARCIPAAMSHVIAMPHVMVAIHPMEIVIMPDTMLETFATLRRIFTDGRADTDCDGRFDTLAIETRWINGPHSYDDSGIPLRKDEQAVIEERISPDKGDPRVLHDEITTIDNASCRPWTVTESYRRVAAAQPVWTERICSEDGQTIRIGEVGYGLGSQSPPDLRHFQ